MRASRGLKWENETYKLKRSIHHRLCADQLDTSTPPPPGRIRAFEVLKIVLFNCPPPLAKIVFKCPTLSSDLACVLTYQHMSLDPIYDDAVYKNTT